MSFQLYAENIQVPIGKLSCFRYYCIRTLHTIVFSVRKGFSRSVVFDSNYAKEVDESLSFIEVVIRSGILNTLFHPDISPHGFRHSGQGPAESNLSTATFLTSNTDYMGKHPDAICFRSSYRKDPGRRNAYRKSSASTGRFQEMEVLNIPCEQLMMNMLKSHYFF